MFAPHAVIAEMPAVIAPEHDDGVVCQFEAIEFVQHASDLRIHVADRRVITMDQCPRLLIGHWPGIRHVAVLTQLSPCRWRIIWRALRRRPAFWQNEGFPLV